MQGSPLVTSGCWILLIPRTHWQSFTGLLIPLPASLFPTVPFSVHPAHPLLHGLHQAIVNVAVNMELNCLCTGGHSVTIHKLQALVYDILPASTTAVFSYTIGSKKLSANEQFFCWCSNSSKFVINNSNNIRRLFYNWPCCLRQLK